MDRNINVLSSNRENNLLLDAIRNKFDDKSATEAASFSPSKFNIPILKIPGGNSLGNINIDHENANSQSTQSGNSAAQLNHFLLKQLKDKHGHNSVSQKDIDFSLPVLESFSDNDKGTVKFELPAMKMQPTNSYMGSLTKAINKLKVQDETKSIKLTSANIDLTTALSSKFEKHQGTPPTRDLIKPQHPNEQDFDIPFIDCDLLETSRKQKIILSASNEYCIIDVSQMLLHHSLTEPSAIGRFLSIGNKKYLNPLPLKCLDSEFRHQKVKHSIEPFNFDTKSPDDLVQLALSQNHRRHYN